jgi:hypothetical protein
MELDLANDCDGRPPRNHAVVGTAQQQLKMQIAVRNETALFTGARIAVYVGSLGQLPVRSGLASASAVVWLTPWAALDQLWLATDPRRCRGLIIAMAFPERRRRHPSGTVRVALPQRARSRPHPPPPSTRSGPTRLPAAVAPMMTTTVPNARAAKPRCRLAVDRHTDAGCVLTVCPPRRV